MRSRIKKEKIKMSEETKDRQEIETNNNYQG